MELRLLEYFLTVVREENISRAAEVLHVTQPTLSRQMKELEDELHTTLFIRGKRLTLTDSGVMLRRRVEEVVTLMKKIDSDFQEQEEISGIISVGSGGLKAAELLPELIEHFRARYPLVSFELHTGTADHVKEELEHGLLDFGILLEPVDIEKFDYIRLPESETWGLLMPADHPLAKEKAITRKKLKEQPLVVTSRNALKRLLSCRGSGVTHCQTGEGIKDKTDIIASIGSMKYYLQIYESIIQQIISAVLRIGTGDIFYEYIFKAEYL